MDSKNIVGIVIIVVLGIVLLAAAIFFMGQPDTQTPDNGSVPDNGDGQQVACTADAKLCPDGSYVGRVAPSCEFAACPDPTVPQDVQQHIDEKSDLIQVDMPEPNTVITSPLTVRGEARGPWYFEATFSVVIVDWDGRIIGEGFATAQDEWMTEEFVPFEGTITFNAATATQVSNRGSIIFQKANPSGLPENDDALEYPVLLGGN